MDDLISRQNVIDALGERPVICDEWVNEYALGQRSQYDSDKLAIETVPSAQPESYKEKLKEIADALSEKFAYMNTCLNERDIILGYLGVKRSNKIHCNTDCTNIKCESHHCNKKLPSAQSEHEYTMEEFMFGQDMGNPEDGSL